MSSTLKLVWLSLLYTWNGRLFSELMMAMMTQLGEMIYCVSAIVHHTTSQLISMPSDEFT